jgi:hypothetical protein
MQFTPLDSSPWSAAVHRLAADVGLSNYDDGLFWFQFENGPQVYVEPLAEGKAVALHASLGSVMHASQDADELISGLLNANAPRHRAPVCAIDPTDGQIVLFQRFDDAGISYEDFVERVHAFAERAAGGLEVLLRPKSEDVPQNDSALANADAFRHILTDFAFQRGFAPVAAEVAESGECLVALGDGGGVLIQFEAATSTVLLKSVMAFMPMDEEDMGAAQLGEFLRPLLEGHLLGEATRGACFAIDDRTGDLVAYRHLALEGLDGHRLGEALDEIAEVSVRFAHRINLKMPNLA